MTLLEYTLIALIIYFIGLQVLKNLGNCTLREIFTYDEGVLALLFRAALLWPVTLVAIGIIIPLLLGMLLFENLDIGKLLTKDIKWRNK